MKKHETNCYHSGFHALLFLTRFWLSSLFEFCEQQIIVLISILSFNWASLPMYDNLNLPKQRERSGYRLLLR